MSVVDEIAAERRRQIEAEGWTPEHDDEEHGPGDLSLAAMSYAHPAVRDATALLPALWPWTSEWWKPRDRRRNLVRAAALIVAEIERLDREASK